MSEQEIPISIEFDCPYCNKTITVAASLVSPEVQIRCGGCKALIPAGAMYDAPSVS